MDIRFRFPFLKPVLLQDAWPLEGYGAIIEFERQGDEAKKLVITFKGQPIDKAPEVTQSSAGRYDAEIKFRHDLEGAAVNIAKRFLAFINFYFSIEIDLNDVEVEFIPANEEEREQIKVRSFRTSNVKRPARVPFSMMAQAFFAGEGVDDISFVSALARMARDASIGRQFIEAFRYSFLLFEALYGDGKFKQKQLVDALNSSRDFVAMVEETISEFTSNDPLFRDGKGRSLAARFPTAPEIINHLVSERGFYFHGNIKRKDTWKPDEQEGAEELASFTVSLALTVANSFATAMFEPEIGKRYFENAKKQGATMSIEIHYSFRGEDDVLQRSVLKMNVPGQVPTNEMAISVQKRFLEWAETELHGNILISAAARDESTKIELFRAQYFVPELAKNDEKPDKDASPKTS